MAKDNRSSSRARPFLFTDAQGAPIVADYLSGMGAPALARKWGCGRTTIHRLLARLGVPSRTRGQAASLNRRHRVDESSLEHIDTEQKAYFLGWWAADGSVSDQLSSVTTNVAYRDHEHLLKLRAVVDSSSPIRFYCQKLNGRIFWRARLHICSKRVRADLIRHGIIPDKTWSLRPWEGPPHLMPAYWRGVFDGDGSICRTISHHGSRGRTWYAWQLNLVGNKHVVSGFEQFVRHHIGIRADICPNRNIFRVWYSHRRVIHQILQLLYSGATIYLSRKHARAEALAAELTTAALPSPRPHSRPRGG